MAENGTTPAGRDPAVDESKRSGFGSGRAPVPGESTRPEPPTAEYPNVDGRPDDPELDRGARPEPVAGPAGPGAGFVNRGMRALFWLVATIGLVMVLIFGAQSVGWLPEFKNPFATQTKDRSQPPLLQSIQDLSRYVAAEGNFQVVIDVQQNQKYIPDFLLNDRILFIAAGTVDAYVEFGNLSQGAIKESDDRRTAEFTLPAPQLGKPNLDPENSRIFAYQRGLVNRVRDAFASDPNRLKEVYKLSEERIAEAAMASGLRQRAEENTRKMLEGLLRSLGYTTVTVRFAAP